MKKMLMFTIRDAKAEGYLPPFAMRNAGEALRQFEDSVHDSNLLISKHPGDFFLFQVGSFDPDTGIIEPCAPVSLACGLDFVKE